MCSQEKRLRTCLLIASLTMIFTSRMTRHLLTAHLPTSGTELVLLREFLDDILGKGFIRLSHHQAVPQSFAKKKDGTLRLCVDFQNLNKITRKDRYPIPLVTTSSTSWAARRSTPSSTSMLATIMFASLQATSGRQLPNALWLLES